MESLELHAKPERHVVATLGHQHPRLADAVANARLVFGRQVWIEPGAVLCDDHAACDAIQQFVDEYVASATSTTFIDDVRDVEDLADGESALPQPGQRWVVYPIGSSQYTLDSVSHLVRHGDTIFAVGETDYEHFPVTGDRSYVLQLR